MRDFPSGTLIKVFAALGAAYLLLRFLPTDVSVALLFAIAGVLIVWAANCAARYGTLNVLEWIVYSAADAIRAEQLARARRRRAFRHSVNAKRRALATGSLHV